MCGIFGIINSACQEFDEKILIDLLKNLYILSESRGKEASGIAIRYNNTIDVLKAPVPASRFIQSKKYQMIIQKNWYCSREFPSCH